MAGTDSERRTWSVTPISGIARVQANAGTVARMPVAAFTQFGFPAELKAADMPFPHGARRPENPRHAL